MSKCQRQWIKYCLINGRGDHGATDEELASVRAEMDAIAAIVQGGQSRTRASNEQRREKDER